MIGDGEPPHLRCYAAALALAAIAGAVDAIGFLHFRTFYVSFMSGNTTRVAVAVAGADPELATRGAAIIASFVVGVVIGDLLTGEPPSRRRATLLAEAALLLAAALLGPSLASSMLLAVAMGMHNALVLRAEGIGVALTYVTGTLVHVGRAIAARLAARSSPPPLWPMLGLWIALGTGATLGAVGSSAGERTELTTVAAILATISVLTGTARGKRET